MKQKESCERKEEEERLATEELRKREKDTSANQYVLNFENDKQSTDH